MLWIVVELLGILCIVGAFTMTSWDWFPAAGREGRYDPNPAIRTFFFALGLIVIWLGFKLRQLGWGWTH